MTPPEAGITELPSSPGARLKREREARGLTEQQAAEALNLDPTAVAALEGNDFGALGAPVFVKGHLRRYAALLGLSEDEIVGAYERTRQQTDEPTLVPRSRIEMSPARGRSRWPLVIGGTAAFLGAAALLSYVSEHGLPWSRTQAPEDADTLDTLALPGPALPVTPVDTAPDRPASAGVAAEAGPGEAPVIAPGTAAPPAPAPLPAPGQVSLQLQFNADSWVEVFDGSGKAVLYDLGKSGSERTITATAPLSVTLGNASAVRVTINGQQATPRSQGSIARFSVAADGTLR